MINASELIDAYLDGVIGDEEFESFKDWLRADAEHRQEFAAASAVHAGIFDWASQTSGKIVCFDSQSGDHFNIQDWFTAMAELEPKEGAVELVRLAEDPLPDGGSNLARVKRYAASVFRGDPLKIVVWGSVAAAILLLASLVLFQESPQPAAPAMAMEFNEPKENLPAPVPAVGILVSDVDAVWKTGTDHTEGVVREDQLLSLTHGMAKLVLNDGAEIILQAPVALVAGTANAIKLRAGKITASVPPSAYGFEVHTPTGVVTDYGTEFGVHVLPDGQAKTHVFNGKVGLASRWADQEVILRSDQAATIEQTGNIKRTEPASLAFVSDREYIARKDSATSGVSKWLAYSYDIRRDPALVVFSQSTSPTYSTTGGAAGRWPQTTAHRFANPEHELVFAGPEQVESLTLSVWLRPSSKPVSDISVLAISDGWFDTTGAVAWQVMEGGEIKFSISSELDGEGAVRDEVSSTSPIPLFTEHAGQWTHLAVVYDAKRGIVSHYLNGKRHEQTPLKNDGLCRMGELHVGNWGRMLEDAKVPVAISRRVFTGDLEDFVFLSRSMSDKEIMDLYQAGARGSQ